MAPRAAIAAALETQFVILAERVKLRCPPAGSRQRQLVRFSVSHNFPLLIAQNREAAVAEVTPSGDEAKVRIIDLALAGFAAQLPRRLDDMIGAPDVRFR